MVTSVISKTEFDSKYYNIVSGKVLILNNSRDFRVPDITLTDREGSDIDASTFGGTISALPGFEDYEQESDLTKLETFQWFESVKKKMKDNPMDCLILVLLSHGFDGGFYAVDQPITFDEIISVFNAENCPELRFKPKVIISQCGRGKNLRYGVNVAIDPNINKTTDAVGGDTKNQPWNTKGDDREYLQWLGIPVVRLPNEADFMFAYATVPGAPAFRINEKGSPFIQQLCAAIHKLEVNEDFCSVLTTVNKTVGLKFQPKNQEIELDRVVQMPCFVSHLTKILRLKQN